MLLYQLLFGNPIFAFAWIIAIIIAISFHEFSHAWSAFVLGDPTPKDLGRLTINPLKHLDIVGTLLLFFAGFGWGKPVPFNPYNLRNQRWGPALVAFSGPLSNVILAGIFGVVLKIVVFYNVLSGDNGLFQLIEALVFVNLILAVFNIIPIPPLDGSKILYAFLPKSTENFVYKLERWGPFVLIFMVIFGATYFELFFSTVVNWVYRLIF